jgi:uncharacterized protein YjbI with pentapeptide repeats
VLKQGSAAWNAWRNESSALRPDLSHANLSGVDLSFTDLSGADLDGASLSQADLSRAKLRRVNASDADLHRANLGRADLFDANLSRADLSGANLNDADLSDASLRQVNLTGASLSRASLIRANFTGADLSDANLRGASLYGATLSATDLGRADLGGASLSAAIVVGADLGDADLSGALLTFASLRGANLARTVLTDARIGETVLADVDLRTAVGLETLRHFGPSTVGIDTLFRSHGEIPEAFLRDCGVPSSFIAYARSLAAAAIEYDSCFIGYSSKDRAFAERLRARMQTERLRVWSTPEDMDGGERIEEQIDRGGRSYDKLLLVISPHSMGSEWLKAEILKARQREALEKRRVLFPIRLVPPDEIRDWKCFDVETGRDLAREIREHALAGFTGWKDAPCFEAEFARLLAELRGKASA